MLACFQTRPSTSSSFVSQAENFFASEPNAGAGARARTQALEEARKNVGWLERHSNTLYEWLRQNAPKTAWGKGSICYSGQAN